MFSRLVTAGLAIATLASATPTIAQTSPEDRRFADAQARFDREYQIYRQAVDRYQAYRAGTYPAPAYNGGGYYPPRRPSPPPRAITTPTASSRVTIRRATIVPAARSGC